MTLHEMVEELEGSYGNRFQIGQADILRYLDIAQKAAFNRDCRAFVRAAPLMPAPDAPFFYDFPADARQIISTDLPEYQIDMFSRKIHSRHSKPSPTVRYYLRPETLTGTDIGTGELAFSAGDEAKVIVPDEWRWQVLAQPAMALCGTANYGDKSSEAMLAGFFTEWWRAMSDRPNDRQPIASAGAWP